MKTYNELILKIEELKKQPASPIRDEVFSVIKQMVNSYAKYIRKLKSLMSKDPTFGGLDDDFLTSFFGGNELRDHELKLKELRKKLRGLSAKDKV